MSNLARVREKYVTVKRSLGEREIVKDPKCRGIGGRVSHCAAHQQPGQGARAAAHHADAGGDLILGCIALSQLACRGDRLAGG